MGSFVVVPHSNVVRVYRERRATYVSSCQVDKHGGVGFMHTINGTQFYDVFKEQTPELLTTLKVYMLVGQVTIEHERLMRFALRRVATVKRLGVPFEPEDIDGVLLNWVYVKGK